MRITLKFTIIMSAIFAVVCFVVAVRGFLSLAEMTDAVQRAEATGYSWFWAFLGFIASAFGVLGVWLIRTGRDEA